jgi:hypothetical protein
MRRINRAFTNPAMRTIAGRVPPLAIVQHLGRRSGQSYRTPVLAFPTDEGYVSPNPRIVNREAALPLLPALLRPGLRLANLPGYLLLDRSKAQAKRRRRS